MIRPAMPSDISKLLDLAEVMHSESKYKVLNFNRNKFGNFILNLMKNSCLVGFVDEKETFIVSKDGKEEKVGEGKIVGAILSYITDYFFGDDMLLMECGFFVLPKYRKSKSGAKLLRAWINIAEKLNVKEACLSTASLEDTAALDHLCKKVGMEHIGNFYKVKFYGNKVISSEAA